MIGGKFYLGKDLHPAVLFEESKKIRDEIASLLLDDALEFEYDKETGWVTCELDIDRVIDHLREEHYFDGSIESDSTTEIDD